MPAEHRHHVSGSLHLAGSLAATAGFVDAFVYTRVLPVFVANMSGNLIHLGVAAGTADGGAVIAAAMALSGFVAGVVIATAMQDVRLAAGHPPSPTALLYLEAMLLVVVVAILRVGDRSFTTTIGPVQAGVTTLAALAMGLQVVALRRVGKVAVSTTYGTGAIVRLGEKVALGVRGAPASSDVRRRATIFVLCVVLLGYVGGAALGSALGGSPFLLLIPAAAAFAAAVWL
jgi:uncharacterized membrane protein YoaK (UPF0700 family)